jgi:hypothetical protein
MVGRQLLSWRGRRRCVVGLVVVIVFHHFGVDAGDVAFAILQILQGQWGVPWGYPKMDGLSGKILFKWMIWGTPTLGNLQMGSPQQFRTVNGRYVGFPTCKWKMQK